MKFWLPDGEYLQEVFIPPAFVEAVMLPAAAHEAGHLVVAHELGARVVGVAVGFLPERMQAGMHLHAIYGWETVTPETECVVKAAGPAADLMFRGRIDEGAASGDLHDIEELTGVASLEPHLGVATDILTRHREALERISAELRTAMLADVQRVLGPLPNNRLGVMLLNEQRTMACFAKTS